MSESQVIGYLETLAAMPLSGAQGEFFKWQHEQARQVEIDSYKSNPVLWKLISEFLERFTPELKGCYKTAAQAVLFDPSLRYVEGMVASVIPIQHAWNCIDGLHSPVHFDLTEECVLRPMQDVPEPKPRALTDYVVVVELNHEELADILVKHEFYGETIGAVFREQADDAGN